MAAKVEWVRGWRGTKIVTLPDESKLTSMMLAKELKLTKHTAIARINAYINNDSLIDLILLSACITSSLRLFPLKRETFLSILSPDLNLTTLLAAMLIS